MIAISRNDDLRNCRRTQHGEDGYATRSGINGRGKWRTLAVEDRPRLLTGRLQDLCLGTSCRQLPHSLFPNHIGSTQGDIVLFEAERLTPQLSHAAAVTSAANEHSSR